MNVKQGLLLSTLHFNWSWSLQMKIEVKSDHFMIFYVFELVPMKRSLSASMICFIPSTCQSSQINHSVQMGFLSCLKLNSRHCNFHLMVTPTRSQSLLRKEEKCEFMWIESSNTGYCVFFTWVRQTSWTRWSSSTAIHCFNWCSYSVAWIWFWCYRNFGYFEQNRALFQWCFMHCTWIHIWH